ncbi:MAG TPA: hypothetical protein VFZ23_08275, partial [Pyrinomonadaceae bacterium]
DRDRSRGIAAFVRNTTDRARGELIKVSGQGQARVESDFIRYFPRRFPQESIRLSDVSGQGNRPDLSPLLVDLG